MDHSHTDMNVITKSSIVSNPKKVVLVTAFYDIGRGEWSSYQRSANKYMTSFKNYLDLEYEMFVFLDDRYMAEFADNKRKNVVFIPINMDWLRTNCKSWAQLDRVRNIMYSVNYRTLLKDRIENGHPENISPQYNIVNHSKIDFINYLITEKLVTSDTFVCWSDFGYHNSILQNDPHRFPTSALDPNKFNLTKLNFCLRNTVIPEDSDILTTLLVAREVFTGSFFAGPVDKMIELYELYHECLDELYDLNLSDDDQHIYLRCFLKKPELFALYLSQNEWPRALTYFQYNFKDRLDLIKYHTDRYNSQSCKFVEIGVCRGVLSDFLLANNELCELYCVDPFISYGDYEDSCNNFVGDNLYTEVSNLLSTKYGSRVMMVRSFSKDAASQVSDNIDFVYIDGNHKYPYVFEDLTVWYNKLKIGGTIICDDAVDIDDTNRDENGDVFIEWCQGCSSKYGVVKACRDFCRLNNIKYQRIDTQIVIHKRATLDTREIVVGFLSNKLTLRGTEVALYDYADYNEKILGNKSIIVTRDYEKIKNEFDVSPEAYNKFQSRFKVVYYDPCLNNGLDDVVLDNAITHLFIEKSGSKDGLLSKFCKNMVHCVFTSNEKHGEVYSVLGRTINETYGTNYPVMPYMVTLPECSENLRRIMGIPEDAVVFGRHGGYDSFDIDWVKQLVSVILYRRKDVWFLFLNTEKFINHQRAIFLPGTTDMIYKKKFVNTCDAMIHARTRGETFGLACGEFAICMKPVITFRDSREKEHIYNLGDKAILYSDKKELYEIMMDFKKNNVTDTPYLKYTPDYVMSIFKELYL